MVLYTNVHMHMCTVHKSVILNVLVMFAVHVVTDFCLFLCFVSLLLAASMKRPLISTVAFMGT